MILALREMACLFADVMGLMNCRLRLLISIADAADER